LFLTRCSSIIHHLNEAYETLITVNLKKLVHEKIILHNHTKKNAYIKKVLLKMVVKEEVMKGEFTFLKSTK